MQTSVIPIVIAAVIAATLGADWVLPPNKDWVWEMEHDHAIKWFNRSSANHTLDLYMFSSELDLEKQQQFMSELLNDKILPSKRNDGAYYWLKVNGKHYAYDNSLCVNQKSVMDNIMRDIGMDPFFYMDQPIRFQVLFT
jgi:hypothetical protein